MGFSEVHGSRVHVFIRDPWMSMDTIPLLMTDQYVLIVLLYLTLNSGVIYLLYEIRQ